MAGITSNTGLISGLPVNDLITAMLAPSQQPIDLLKTRISGLSDQRTAFLKISANLLAILNTSTSLKDPAFFQSAKATSSDETSILATANSGAPTGSFQITVERLAAAHQLITGGFATADTTPVGAGNFTIETAQALLNQSSRLASLRGGQGVSHGKFRVTDKAGGSSVIDLSSAVTIDDVVNSINNQSSANVKARVEGDHLIVTDQTGLASGSLAISDIGNGSAANDLGIVGTAASGAIVGQNLVAISSSTRLDELNDSNGIRRAGGAPDFSVSLADGTSLDISLSDRLQLDTPLSQLNSGGGVPAGSIHVKTHSGTETDINLSTATTIGDVLTQINGAGLGLTATLGPTGLVIKDTTTGTKSFEISDTTNGSTAKSLGIVGVAGSDQITGKKVFFVDSVGDAVRLINTKAGNNGKLVAGVSSDGLGLTLTDTTFGAGTFKVTATNNSKAAEDLGLLAPANGNTISSRRLLSSLDSVLLKSLRGGAGVSTGTIQLTDRAGVSASVDLSSAQSLADVVTSINGAGTGLRASVSANGLGLEINDTSGGSGNLSISDVSGTLAADLHINANQAASRVSSGNLQRQYVTESTRLANLRNGDGIPPGKFRITDSKGATAIVDLTQGNEERVQDVLDEINSRGIGVTASINANGDGILLTDTAGGAGLLTVTEEGGTTAKALNILGKASTGQTTINGAFEYNINVTGGDTLNDVVAKIKAAGAPVSATVLRDGASNRPFRLSLASNQSGLDGQLAIDAGATGLSFSTLVQASDATLIFGPTATDNPLVLSSNSNTFTDVVPNVRLDLVGLSGKTTTVSIGQDSDSIVKSINLFVSSVNTALSTIDDLTHYDDQTNTRSVLTGDATTREIRSQIVDILNQVVPGLSSKLNRLSSIGVDISNGTSVTFDQDKFKAAFAADPDGVQALFTTKDTGLGNIIDKVMKKYTDTNTGVLTQEDSSIQKSSDLLTNRITDLQTLLESKRQRLLAQFNAMEQAISQLQSQQQALGGISALSVA